MSPCQYPEFLKVALLQSHDCAKYLRICANFQIMKATREIWPEFHVFVTIDALFLVLHAFDDIFTACFAQYFQLNQFDCQENSLLESLSIPWVHVYTMIPCLYHESMSIPWVHVYTMSPFLYHESMSIPWFHVHTMNPSLYDESLSITKVIVHTMRQDIKKDFYTNNKRRMKN